MIAELQREGRKEGRKAGRLAGWLGGGRWAVRKRGRKEEYALPFGDSWCKWSIHTICSLAKLMTERIYVAIHVFTKL